MLDEYTARAQPPLESRMSRRLLPLVALAACGTQGTPAPQPTEDVPPLVTYDPAQGLLPTPNDAHRAGDALSVPAPECETDAFAALRLQGNALDGYGTFQPLLRAAFSEPVDEDSLADRVLLFELLDEGSPVPASAAPRVDTLAVAGDRLVGCDALTPAVDIIPARPLESGSTYVVVLLAGITTLDGVPFEAADAFRHTFSITPPDSNTDAWSSAQPLLDFATTAAGVVVNQSAAAPVDRQDLLLAWTFTTQTTRGPLDPTWPGGPAAALGDTSNELTITETVEGASAVAALLETQLGVGSCNSLACEQVGAIVTATFVAPRFGQGTVPGAFSHPLTPEVVVEDTLEVLAFVPQPSFVPSEANARPTVIFGHGMGRSKEDLYALAIVLAEHGFASVAIDLPLHGSRAVQVSSGPGCGGLPSPVAKPQCFAPLFADDFAATRDRVRQGVLDLEKLLLVLASCGPEGTCGALKVDPSRTGYLGQSFGALVGAIAVAESPELEVAVLNVGGANWLEVIAESPTPAVRCPFVDALIDAEVIEGNRWNLGAGGPASLCYQPDWAEQPAYPAFASAARALLDAAEPANHAEDLTTGHVVLVQEVLGDTVMPNGATETLTGLLGLAGVWAATPSGDAPLQPSGAPDSGAASGASAWVIYESDPAAKYAHGSLVWPADATQPSLLGTAQMQADAVFYFLTNL